MNVMPSRTLVTVSVASPVTLRDSNPSHLKEVLPTPRRRPSDLQAGVTIVHLASSERVNSQPRAIVRPGRAAGLLGETPMAMAGRVAGLTALSASFLPWPRHRASLQCLPHPQHHSAPAWRALHRRWEDLQPQEQHCPQCRHPLCGRR